MGALDGCEMVGGFLLAIGMGIIVVWIRPTDRDSGEKEEGSMRGGGRSEQGRSE